MKTSYQRRRQNWPRPWSTRLVPYARLAAEDIRSFVAKGWRVVSPANGLYTPVQ